MTATTVACALTGRTLAEWKAGCQTFVVAADESSRDSSDADRSEDRSEDLTEGEAALSFQARFGPMMGPFGMAGQGARRCSFCNRREETVSSSCVHEGPTSVTVAYASRSPRSTTRRTNEQSFGSSHVRSFRQTASRLKRPSSWHTKQCSAAAATLSAARQSNEARICFRRRAPRRCQATARSIGRHRQPRTARRSPATESHRAQDSSPSTR